MFSEESVAIEPLLRSLPKQDRQDRFIRKVLEGLRAEGHSRVERVVVPSWAPILVHGDPTQLYVVLSGNASVAFSRELAVDPKAFTRALMRIGESPSPVSKLNEIAHCHPIVLCKGDLIGEFEYVQKPPIISHVISGTFFKMPQTRSRLQTTLLRLPADSAFAAKVSLHVMTEKLVLINHLLLPAIHKGLDRINNILACCFAGLLPVYRAFYQGQREGELEVVAPDCCAGTREQDTEFISLSRLDPTRDPVGIEISTLYLLRCFGFASRDSITSDLNGFDVAVYSEDHARDRASRPQAGGPVNGNRHQQRIESYWDRYSLGTESMLFFLKDCTAHDFCAAYGVDLQHKLFGEALAAV
jgi:hypothetical protein